MWSAIGILAWLALVTMALALLTAAKRGDEQMERDNGQFSLETIGDELGRPVSAVVVAMREPRPVGQAVAVVAQGDAAGLTGCVLAPDDSLTARAAFTGCCEFRAYFAAVPLKRGEDTIGAIGVGLAPDRAPFERHELERLTHTAEGAFIRSG